MIARAQRPTELRLKPAATIEAERRRASQSGAAPRGAGVQAGSGGGRACRPVGPVRRPGGGGGPTRLGPPGGLIPICLVCGGDRAGAGAPCTPPQHPDYIYQQVLASKGPATPSPITQSGQDGPSLQGKSDISLPRRPCPGSGPLLCGLAGGSNPRSPARSGLFGAREACSGPGCAPGNHRGALAVRRAPHPTITLRIHPGQGGAAVSRAAGPDARATRERRTRPVRRRARATPAPRPYRCRRRPS